MNYAERCNAIGTLLRETILPRTKRPDHLDDDTARRELADMTEDLNAEWPVMTRDRFDLVSEALARTVRTTHKSRTWPTIGHLVDALKQTLGKINSPGIAHSAADSGDWQEAAKRTQLRAWWYDHKPCPAHFVTRERLQAIGLNSWDVDRAMAELADPRNAGAIR